MLYDRIGTTYAATRQPDPRLRRLLADAAGTGTKVDVGAGTGSYELPGTVLAVEPSATMIDQRPTGHAPAVRAVAESLPLAADSVDVATAVLTLHHWTDWRRGVAELVRVARRRVVIFTWLPSPEPFWFLDLIPELVTLDEGRFPTAAALAEGLGPVEVTPWPIPHDCRDGFLAAWWRRPEAYLDPAVRAGISGLQQLPDAVTRRWTKALRDQLDSGQWRRDHADLLTRDSLDVGYRMLVADAAARKA